MSIAENIAYTAPTEATASRSKNHLYGPLADFMLLGGGSAIFLFFAWLIIPESSSRTVLFITFLLANVINHPHFGHSYQMFYDNFRAKAFGDQYSSALRIRYIVAGIVAPLLLAAYFISGLMLNNPAMIGFGVNIMAFFVGWHYVKQGYGILMLDAALKKRFMTAEEKRLFLVNAYATWGLSWLWANKVIYESEWWGLTTYTFNVPDILVYLAAAAAIGTFLLCAYALMKRQLAGQPTAWNGVVAYVVSIYPWMLFMKVSPIVALLIPAAHSLQYLAVVWRYQLNKSDEHAATAENKTAKKSWRMASFVFMGTVLGFMGFWGLPLVLDTYVPYDKELFGPFLFIAIFWLFINVHHYFLDNVMWRRENTDMKKYLFS